MIDRQIADHADQCRILSGGGDAARARLDGPINLLSLTDNATGTGTSAMAAETLNLLFERAVKIRCWPAGWAVDASAAFGPGPEAILRMVGERGRHDVQIFLHGTDVAAPPRRIARLRATPVLDRLGKALDLECAARKLAKQVEAKASEVAHSKAPRASVDNEIEMTLAQAAAALKSETVTLRRNVVLGS